MVFEIDNVAGIEQAIKYMRFPKDGESSTPSYELSGGERVYDFDFEDGYDICVSEEDWELANRLSVSRGGTGNDNYLKGIVVWLTVDAPQYWWLQAQRYHWFDIVSSSSKMHTLLNDDIDTKCRNCEEEQVALLKEAIGVYRDYGSVVDFGELLDLVPMGYHLKAGVVTNYLQLKTMYRQRKNHRLKIWNTDFVKMIKTLPLHELITG